MAKKGRRATHEERIAAVEMLRKGISADRVADILNVSRASVFAWLAAYRQGGQPALSTSKYSANPCVTVGLPLPSGHLPVSPSW